jgi:hypothetical protein
MFEQVLALWKAYRLSRSHEWPAPDPRADLAAEVENRIGQLDLILNHLQYWLGEVRPDPETWQRDSQEFMRDAERFRTGQITENEYAAIITSRSPKPSPRWFHAWSEIRLFTETFYFFAWRILEILTTSSPRAFAELRSIDAPGIRLVRNLLVHHPEDGKSKANYSQTLVVTDDGPVLKSSAFAIRADRIEAVPESIDRGLYRNAEEFRDVLEARLRRVIARNEGDGKG